LNWYEANTEKFEQFIDWFLENPLHVDEENFFTEPNTSSSAPVPADHLKENVPALVV
jgi:hypothetical protein